METIYILTNNSMPNLIKIGFTKRDDLNIRVKELYTTGVPLPFNIYYACLVEDSQKTEDILHELFIENRINKKREFFQLDPEKVITALSLLNPINITPDEKDYLTTEEIKDIEKTKKQKNFTFSEVDIDEGTTLTFARDPNITCTVHSNNTVIYNNEILTLTEAARKTNLIPYKELQGPKFWMYENETLTNRRKKFHTT
jgi:hypothetical protein